MTESTIIGADETPPGNTFVMTRDLDLQLRRFIRYLRWPGVRVRLIDSFVRNIVSRGSETIGDPSALAIHEVETLLAPIATFSQSPRMVFDWTTLAYSLKVLVERAEDMEYWDKTILPQELIPSKETIDSLIAEFNRQSLTVKPSGWDGEGND